MNPQYFIGLMSGTSMDGVDAVLVKFIDQHWHGIIHHTHIPFEYDLKEALLDLQNTGYNELHNSALLSQKLTQLYAQAVHQLIDGAKIKQAITAIGCHGQTIRHNPQQHYTIQLANWALLSELTHIAVVGDFRATDIAAQGQGAPLVPAFHHALFSSFSANRVIANIGGICNITILQKNHEVFGFDSGPGNMLMDAWTEKYWQQPFDHNGDIARSGQIIIPLLEQLTSHEYFQRIPPKSTGRDLFSLSWLNQFLTQQEDKIDVLATLCAFTVSTLSQAILQYASDTHELILCGGGAYNTFLRAQLQKQLPHIKISDTSILGIAPQQVEAAAFAWLAFCRIHRIPANIPSATGAEGLRVLGAIWDPRYI